jgi:hypothetical protein
MPGPNYVTSQMVCGECEPKRFPRTRLTGTPIIACKNLTRTSAPEVVTAQDTVPRVVFALLLRFLNLQSL